jgi:hypothetical protein
MAIKKEIEININTNNAEKNLNDVFDVLKDIQKQNVKVESSFEDTNKSIKNAEKSTDSLAKGFKGAGLALKAMGVGLIIQAFNILKDLFMSNQKIADVFSTAIKSLSIVFNDLFDFIFENVPKVADFFKQIFENPAESLKKLGQAIQDNLIERFESALEVAGHLSSALVKLFKGDFKGALSSVKDAGVEMLDVFTGVDDSANKIVNGVTNLVNAASEYAKETWNTAEALQAQENAAKRAVAIQSGLVEQYDRQAEKLRQIRDSDLNSLDERIKANEELAKVLEEQEKAMLAQANLQVQAAKNQYNLNKNIENEVALIEARNNVKAVEAQIEGFRSEQLTNRNSLEKESIDLLKSKIQNENELAINQKKFDAERTRDVLRNLQLQRESLETEKETELLRLENNILLYKANTQARLDAETEYALKKQEIDNALITNQDQIDMFNFEQKSLRLQETANLENESLSVRLAALRANNELIQQSNLHTEEEKRKAAQQTAEQEKILQAQRVQMLSNTLGNITSALGENSKAGKAFAIAQALINTYQGITAELATKTATPFEFGLKLANIASTAAIGFKAVKNILKTNPKGGGGGTPSLTGEGGGASATSAPQFNVVGNTGINQLAQTLGTQQPIEAFVVASNVTSAQSINRNIVQNASLG